MALGIRSFSNFQNEWNVGSSYPWSKRLINKLRLFICVYTHYGVLELWKKKEILKKRLLGLHCLLPSCINLVHHRVAFGIPLPSTGLQTNGIPKTWLLKSTAKDFSKDFISYFIICNIWNRMVILLKILTLTTYNKIQ